MWLFRTLCKEYQLTPFSRFCTRMAHTGAPYFPMGRPNKLGPGKKNFWPPITLPWGVRERWNFYMWQRPIGPMSTQNIKPYNLKEGTGGVIKEISPFWGSQAGCKHISDPLGDRNSFSAPGASEMIVTLLAGVKLSKFMGGDESQPPKVDRIFPKSLSQLWNVLPEKPVPPETWFTCCYLDKCLRCLTSNRLECCVQRGLSPSPQTWLPSLQKTCQFFTAAADPLRMPVQKYCPHRIFSLRLP